MRRGVPVWLPKERRYLLWVPLADLYGGLRACPCNIVVRMYPTPGMQDGTVMVRESWLWAVSQSVDPRLAARVGTGVQLLHGKNYIYSRVLGHVQL